MDTSIPEAIEPAARVVLHVTKVIRVHELAMRVQRRKHPLHCRRDEIVIARLVIVYVILPNQLESLCENGNLRVAVIVFALPWLRFLRERTGESTEHETSQQWNGQQTPHIKTEDYRTMRSSLMRKFWQRPTAEPCLN